MKHTALTITWEYIVIDGQIIDQHLVVRSPGHSTGVLSNDEALGCIASFIYGAGDVAYLRPVIEEALYRRRNGLALHPDERDALTAAGEPLVEPEKSISGFLGYEGQEPRPVEPSHDQGVSP